MGVAAIFTVFLWTVRTSSTESSYCADYILMLFASIFLLVYFKSLKIGFSISLCSYCVSVKLGLVCHFVGYMHKQVGGGAF